jgi:hypothetical protein
MTVEQVISLLEEAAAKSPCGKRTAVRIRNHLGDCKPFDLELELVPDEYEGDPEVLFNEIGGPGCQYPDYRTEAPRLEVSEGC